MIDQRRFASLSVQKVLISTTSTDAHVLPSQRFLQRTASEFSVLNTQNSTDLDGVEADL